MDQWTNGPMDHSPMDQWTNGQMVQWTNGLMDQWTNGSMDKWTNAPMDQCSNEPKWSNGINLHLVTSIALILFKRLRVTLVTSIASMD